MILAIDKANNQLTQVKQSVQTMMPFDSDSTVNLSQSWTNSFKGEVKELTIPEAAKNAPLVEN